MEQIEKANEQALERMLSGTPVLVDVVPAHKVMEGLGDRMILHAGPPIEWERNVRAHARRHRWDCSFRRLGFGSRGSRAHGRRRGIRLPSEPSSSMRSAQ